MELDNISLSKTLHYVIEKFLSSMKHVYESEALNLNKMYNEIAKRSRTISQYLRSIAVYACTAVEESGKS